MTVTTENPRKARHSRAGRILSPLPRIRINGRRVPLSFTWAEIDKYGHRGIGEKVAMMMSGKPGDFEALAELISIATSGQYAKADVLDGRSRVYFEEAMLGVARAWHSALYGPPPALPQRWLQRMLRRPVEGDWRGAGLAGQTLMGGYP